MNYKNNIFLNFATPTLCVGYDNRMKKFVIALLLVALSVCVSAQTMDVKEKVYANPELTRGCNYMINFDVPALSKAPRGYKAFYISHYGRHGARYYWGEGLYQSLYSVLSAAAEQDKLTDLGEHLWEQIEANYDDLFVHATELSTKGWEQHREIARRMYKEYPSIFRHHPKVFAASSPVGRCLMSMAAFCLSLKEQNPKLDVMESAGREFYPSIIPMDEKNIFYEEYEGYEFPWASEEGPADLGAGTVDYDAILSRVFTDVEYAKSLRRDSWIVSDLWNFQANTPCSDVEVDTEGLFTMDEKYYFFVRDCASFYSDCGYNRYNYIPMLKDYIARADAAIESGKPAVDLRFGHDGILEAFVILLNVDHFGDHFQTADQIKYFCPLYRIPMGSNIQLVFYKKRFGKGEILVKPVFNGEEATLPFPAVKGNYYSWNDFKAYYAQVIAEHPVLPSESINEE